MESLFQNKNTFNSDISNWDTHNVTNMNHLFWQASAFNQPIDNWDTSNVTTMSGVFEGASAFNQNISSWITDNVTEMTYMFWGASAFNQDISSWCVEQIPEKPEYFNEEAAFTEEPQWGRSCEPVMCNVFTVSGISFNESYTDQPQDKWFDINGDYVKTTAPNGESSYHLYKLQSSKNFTENYPIPSWDSFDRIDDDWHKDYAKIHKYGDLWVLSYSFLPHNVEPAFTTISASKTIGIYQAGANVTIENISDVEWRTWNNKPGPYDISEMSVTQSIKSCGDDWDESVIHTDYTRG
jgi:surface protein